MAPARARNVFTIAPGAPFLPTLAQALLDGAIVAGFPDPADPAALADATIYVPTRRAARALAGELARRAPTPALILPRIVPLGGLEDVENELLFDPASGGADWTRDWREDLPEAVGELDRRMALTELILKWGHALRALRSVDADGRINMVDDEPMLVTTAPAQAFHLAGDLAALIDEMIIEDVDWGRLRTLAPDDYDRYWGITLNFLAIAIEAWPKHLREQGLIDRVSRQAMLIERRIMQMRDSAGADDGRVEIVAGSTGTNAATARLIAAIAASPRGAVVLPGLDLELDEAGWRAIAGEDEGKEPAAGHAQAALRRLLPIIGVARDGVRELGAPTPALAARSRFVSEAMRPAETTDLWRRYHAERRVSDIDAALAGVSAIEAADEREEALALAIVLREALEDPDATAALITPDRNLARRVRAELARWDIEIDDSGGEPLANAPHGVLARLALDCAEPTCAVAPLLALLRHPLTRLGLAPHDLARRVDAAEVGLLRGLRPDLSHPAEAVAIARARSADAHAHRAVKSLRDEDWAAILDLLERLAAALQPLRALGDRAPVKDWTKAHLACVEALVAGPDDAPAVVTEDAGAFALLMDDLARARPISFDFSAKDYAVFFSAAAREAVVRGPRANHPRIKSLGLLEARLIDVDVALLAGLDEAVWPPAARTDAFLNRPMRAELGLSPPERRIGQTAHDFMQALGAERVVISRALKRAGSPTTPSRFLQRLETLAGDAWSACRARGARYVSLARALDTPKESVVIPRPMPKPDRDLRPRSLSVTRIETLRRDPYAIYAERVLKLSPLDGLDLEEGARESGTRMHDMLARFQQAHPSGPLPPDAAQELARIAREIYAQDLRDAAFRAFHWPRVEAVCAAFLEWEATRRATLDEIVTEEKGRLTIPLADRSEFTLTAIADRIERLKDGSYVVIDFKTGNVPSAAMVNCGLSPQLTLESKMLAMGAFGGVAAGAPISSALYVKLGGKDGVSAREATKDGAPIDQAMEEHFAGLLDLLNQFRLPETPYTPRPYPQFVTVWGDYDHLSRYREWSAGGGEGA